MKPEKQQTLREPEVDTPSGLESIMGQLSKLSPEQRAALQGLGVIVPTMGVGGKPVIKWIYRCHDCGAAGLSFIGDKFTNRYGEEVDVPPLDVPIHQIAWTQKGDPNKINRYEPDCQSCGCKLRIRKQPGGNYFLGPSENGPGFLAEAKPWFESRDTYAHYMRKTREDFRRDARKQNMIIDGGRNAAVAGSERQVKQQMRAGRADDEGFQRVDQVIDANTTATEAEYEGIPTVAPGAEESALQGQ
jgi:hypothetical protein